jgi:hypothetical protein
LEDEDKYDIDIFKYFCFSEQDKIVRIDMVDLYTRLIEQNINSDEEDKIKDESLVTRFKAIISDNSRFIPWIMLQNKQEYETVTNLRSAGKFKENLMNMAYNIHLINCAKAVNHLSPEEIVKMGNLFADVLKAGNTMDDNTSKSLLDRYKEIYAIYNEKYFKPYIRNNKIK